MEQKKARSELSGLEAVEALAFAGSHLGLRLLDERLRGTAPQKPPMQSIRDIGIIAETVGSLGISFAARDGSHLQLATKIAAITGFSPTLDIMYNAGMYYFDQSAAARAKRARGRTSGNGRTQRSHGPTIEVMAGPGDSGMSSGNYSGGETSSDTFS